MCEMFKFETANFVVRAVIEPDDDVDLSFDETNETAEKVASGEWQCFGTIVTVSTRDGIELGKDSIWGSVYENPADFFKEHRGARGQYGSYFHDLVRGAISEARKKVNAIRELEVK